MCLSSLSLSSRLPVRQRSGFLEGQGYRGSENQRTFAFPYSPPTTTLCLGILVCLGSFVCVCMGLDGLGAKAVCLCVVCGVGCWSALFVLGCRCEWQWWCCVHPPPHSCTHTLPCALGGGVGEAGLIFVFNY